MDKVLTMSGPTMGDVIPDQPAAMTDATDPTAASTSALSQVVSAWTWKHTVTVVGGSFMVAGGGALAYYGWTRSKKAHKWGGIILAGAGLLAIGIAIVLAQLKKSAVIQGLLRGYGTTPADAFVDPNRVAGRGDMVALTDGRQGRVNALTSSLDGSPRYDVRIVENGTLTMQGGWMPREQIAGVVVVR